MTTPTPTETAQEAPTAAFAARLRRSRLTAGVTVATASQIARVSETTWRAWERGSKTPRLWRGREIASALAIPTGSLFTDEVVLAEVRLSDETLQQIKREGREASRQAAERFASRLEPLIWQEATRPPVDVSPGARPRRRRSRAEVLAGIAEANRMRTAARRLGRIE